MRKETTIYLTGFAGQRTFMSSVFHHTPDERAEFAATPYHIILLLHLKL
jgi:hypothetical protein